MIKYIHTLEEIKNCYPVLGQLRPHLTNEHTFIEQIQRQLSQGYKVACYHEEGKISAVIGFRFLELLAWGKEVY